MIGLPGAATQIAAGSAHAAALLGDGRLFTWGVNAHGQLGVGNYVTAAVPVEVRAAVITTAGTITAIETGARSTYVVFADGTAAAWGSNEFGQLGLDQTAYPNPSYPTPMPMQLALNPFQSTVPYRGITAGTEHAFDIMVSSWGRNQHGQLGDGTTDVQLRPMNQSFELRPVVFSDIVEFALTTGATLLRTAEGLVYAWGNGDFGVLGNGTLNDSLRPVTVVRADGRALELLP